MKSATQRSTLYCALILSEATGRALITAHSNMKAGHVPDAPATIPTLIPITIRAVEPGEQVS